MAIAISVRQYLDEADIEYDIHRHPRTMTSCETAKMAGVPGDQVAKSVILEDEAGYLMAVVPATHHVQLGQLSRQLGRHLGLATEQELRALFGDCELGAIPPVGDAYHMEVIMDDSLAAYPDIYFEGGDHTDLIHVRHDDFHRLMQHARHGLFSQVMSPTR
jgi:Ala-tRNA(Pro) deacylase